jgi:hypothetical protein
MKIIHPPHCKRPTATLLYRRLPSVTIWYWVARHKEWLTRQLSQWPEAMGKPKKIVFFLRENMHYAWRSTMQP